MPDQDAIGILRIVWPLILIQLAAAIWAVADIVKKKKTRTLNTTAWILISLFVNLIGPTAYFLFGRTEE